ncbi:MAG: hypothetical protein ABJZ55_23585 [Fuerstiella sp.]
MKTAMTTVLVLVIAFSVSTSVEAGSLRSWAKREAKLVHQRGAGHYQRMHSKARFVGTGTGDQTCRTNGKARLTVRYKGSTVRVW